MIVHLFVQFYHHLDDIIMIENFFIVSLFSQLVAEHIPMLVQGVRDSIAQPDNPGAQLNLINVSQNFVQVMITFVFQRTLIGECGLKMVDVHSWRGLMVPVIICDITPQSCIKTCCQLSCIKHNLHRFMNTYLYLDVEAIFEYI